MQPGIENTKGILNPKAGGAKFQLARYLPAPDLSFFVEFYWIVSWDLRGEEPYVQETLPFPSVHLVFEQGQSQVFGIVMGRFTRLLENKGCVFGIKFKPGAFYPFVQFPVALLTNTAVDVRDIFGAECAALEELLLSQENEQDMVALAENFLRQRLPDEDEHVKVINDVVNYIISHSEITRVEDLVQQFHLSKRTVQRLFRQYVGVSPKWVIKRYRIQEVVERLTSGEMTGWSTLAMELGYTDQAHFIKDFKAIVGCTPSEYVRRSVSDRG